MEGFVTGQKHVTKTINNVFCLCRFSAVDKTSVEAKATASFTIYPANETFVHFYVATNNIVAKVTTGKIFDTKRRKVQ